MASQPPFVPSPLRPQSHQPLLNAAGLVKTSNQQQQQQYSNGSGLIVNQTGTSRFPYVAPNTNPTLNPPLTPQWSQPPIPGHSSAFSPVIQPNTVITQQNIAANVLPNKLTSNTQSGRPPSTPVFSPSSSEPTSSLTSRNPSPTPSSRFDHMEGQFLTPSGAASPAGSSNNLHALSQPNVNGNANPALLNGTNSPAIGTASLSNQSFPAGNPYSLRPPMYGSGGPPLSAAPFLQSQYGAAYTSSVNGPSSSAQVGNTWNSPQYRTIGPVTTSPHPPPPPNSQQPLDIRRQYPQQANYGRPQLSAPNEYGQFTQSVDSLTPQMSNLSVTHAGFDKLWGYDSVDLLQARNILPAQGLEPPKIHLKQEHLNAVNCSPEIFRCTLTKIPETNAILQKSRLPLGVLIHPFKDLTQLPVIQCQTIVRCRSCRTYINPFVSFVDQRRWKCNLCFRINELPEEFQYDPISNSYGDPSRRPEIKNATIEFIAPSEYMLRPPQPAVYLYLIDTCHYAVEIGYLKLLCDIILDELEKIPGDSRTQIGFITYDSSVHFYSLADGLNQPHQLVVTDIDDIFLPCPTDLLVNLHESKQLLVDLLEQLPTKFNDTPESSSALGAALQAAFKLTSPTGGRITVFHTCLPNIGPGALKSREDPNQRASKDVPNLNPATDFYKKLALDCSGQQVAVDLFLLGGQYMDIASLSCISKYSGGCMYYFPGFHYIHNQVQAERFERTLRRYLTRKIGFESVMRIRCTRGLAIHTFHGNFFVRSTDLLSLPNINPDAGFGLQVSIEENLTDVQNICFQAALLYTSSKGERRIRVHTMCLPITGSISEVIQSADQQCIIGLLSKMAVDRSMQSSIGDARDALINVCVDVLSAYKATQSSNPQGLCAPINLRLLPLYVAALLKTIAFRTGQSTRLDERVFAMNQIKTLPLSQLMLTIYPDLYAVHNLDDQGAISQGDTVIPQPPRLQLSAERVDSTGAYLLDTGEVFILYIGRNIGQLFLENVLGSSTFLTLPEQMLELPELDTAESERLRNFVTHLQNQRPYQAVLQFIREDSKNRNNFVDRLVEGRTESSLSYYEFLQHLKNQVK